MKIHRDLHRMMWMHQYHRFQVVEEMAEKDLINLNQKELCKEKQSLQVSQLNLYHSIILQVKVDREKLRGPVWPMKRWRSLNSGKNQLRLKNKPVELQIMVCKIEKWIIIIKKIFNKEKKLIMHALQLIVVQPEMYEVILNEHQWCSVIKDWITYKDNCKQKMNKLH